MTRGQPSDGASIRTMPSVGLGGYLTQGYLEMRLHRGSLAAQVHGRRIPTTFIYPPHLLSPLGKPHRYHQQWQIWKRLQ